MVETKIEPSKRQAREDVKNGAIYVNGENVKMILTLSSKPDSDFDGKIYVIIRKGKRKHTLVKINTIKKLRTRNVKTFLVLLL